jgi:NhaA family Na+:H+ antiporter
VLNKYFRVLQLWPYMIGGALMWYLMLRSGVHATIAGVLLAFAIPYSAAADDVGSPSHRLEHMLHYPVAFGILPIFALANTGIVVGRDWHDALLNTNSIGIALGLLFGKPIGITLISFAAVAAGICRLPLDLNWKHVFGAGLLGGIGFTMSIFITNLAFSNDPSIINSSKMAIVLASLLAGILGFSFLKLFGRPRVSDYDMDTMDLHATEA